MKTRILTALLLSAILFTSCVKNDDSYTPDNGPVAVKFKSAITAQQTRVVGENWEAGDKIGIYMVNDGEDFTSAATALGADNRHYTTTIGGTNVGFSADASNTIFFPNDNSLVQFKAYYPYDPTADVNNILISTLDQTSQQALDFMVSAKTEPTNKVTNNISLEFTHKLAKVEFTLKAGDGITVEELESATVSFIDIFTDATYSLELEENEPMTAGIKADILTHKLPGSVVAEAIIVPQYVVAGEVQFVIGTDTYKWSYDMDFASGNKYRFDVTVNKLGLDISGTITDWTTGEIIEIIAD